jgi:hypothetical protein
MLFDDDEQLEVRHVVSLAHHNISVYSGGDKTPEGELWIKRNAICLSRRMDGAEIAPDSQVSKPFFLFSENCSAKEDFYFSLLRNQAQNFGGESVAPSPLQFEVKNIISLVQKLHSSEEHLQTRWLNALIGRVFLGLYRTKDVEHFIRSKLTKKIARVNRPAFLTSIAINNIDTGESAPYFTNPRLKDLTVEGECGVEADVRYTGNARIEVAATARFDLGPRFKAREVSLVLAVVLRKLEGHMLFKIKPPPSNRMWFSFQQMPKMEMTLEPIISSRQITWTLILRQIENRIKEVFAETLVLPFWDDVPFFHTEHKNWRGGIWEGDDAVASPTDLESAMAQMGDVDDVDKLEEQGPLSPELPPVEKSHSIPIMENTATTSGLFGRRLNGKISNLSKGTSSSTSVDAKVESPTKPRSTRSNSFVLPATPTTGTDSTNADLFRPSSSPPNESPATEAMASLSARTQNRTPPESPVGSLKQPPALPREATNSSGSSRETTDTEKDRDRTPQSHYRRDTVSTTSSVGSNDNEASSTGSGRASLRSQTGSITRNFFSRRDTPHNSSTTGSGGEPAKRTALAAVTNAAVSARRWGLNALQRHGDGVKDQIEQGEGVTNGDKKEASRIPPSIDLSKPMGGGRPLPPPGVPLPMPDKRTKTAQRRKQPPPPPLPDRQPRSEDRRPVPPPPLPTRRQMASQPQPGDGEGMLVVAAPSDSEPGSPSADDEDGKRVHRAPWAEDVEDEEAGGEASEVAERTPPAVSATPGEEEPQFAFEEDETPHVPQHKDDGEDDYSAWLDDEDRTGFVHGHGEHNPLTEPGAMVTGEGMSI